MVGAFTPRKLANAKIRALPIPSPPPGDCLHTPAKPLSTFEHCHLGEECTGLLEGVFSNKHRVWNQCHREELHSDKREFVGERDFKS